MHHDVLVNASAFLICSYCYYVINTLLAYCNGIGINTMHVHYIFFVVYMNFTEFVLYAYL